MPNRYLPFLTSFYSTAPGLQLLAKGEHPKDRLVFQIDDQYQDFIQNKALCRQEGIKKYYVEHLYAAELAKTVNQYLLNQLLLEHPEIFKSGTSGNINWLSNSLTGEIIEWDENWELVSEAKYLSLFDALCCQVQEDVAVCQLDEHSDWLAALHLCAPNHWAATDKIGKPFNSIHGEIPGMEKTLQHNRNILELLVNKGPYTRFAWGIATDNRLNHHPEAPVNQDKDNWQGRKIENEETPLFIRVEKQNIIGFPTHNAFLFTIRTYFYPVTSLNQTEKSALLQSVKGMSEQSLAYKGLTGTLPILQEILQ